MFPIASPGKYVLPLLALLLLAACGGSGSGPSAPPVDPPEPPPGGDVIPPTVVVDRPTSPAALLAGDAIEVVFRADDNVGAQVAIVLDGDGDADSTGDQIPLWTGGDRNGVTQTVSVDTRGAGLGRWVLLVVADDGSNDPVAAGGPATTGVVVYPALAGMLPPRRNVYGVTDHHVVFAVGEAEQGNQDLNGDGDAGDGVVSQIDALSGMEIATGMTTDIRSIGLTSWARVLGNGTGGIAWERREVDEGRSLNSDGDLLDTMVSFTAPALGVSPVDNRTGGASLTELGTAGQRVATYREIDAAMDLNGDGDTVDTVLAVLDYTTNQLVQVYGPTPRLTAPIVGQGINIAWAVDEASQGLGNRGMDLNGDGDMVDTLLHRTDLPTNSMQVFLVNVDPTAGYSVSESQTTAHYYASEATAGLGSLNGDPDATDFVPTTSLGPLQTFPQAVTPPSPLNAGAGAPTSFVYGATCLYTASEEGLGDRNGDGDTLDTQVLLWTSLPDAAANAQDQGLGLGSLTSLVLDGGSAAQVAPGWISLALSEAANGADLNGDGDVQDVTLLLVDISAGVPMVHKTGLDPLGAGGVLPVGATTIPQTGVGGDTGVCIQVAETANGDLNDDGDLSDTLLYYIPFADPGNPVQLANTGGLHVAVAGGCIGITAHEALTNQDFNGDGDRLDVLFRVVDGEGVVLEPGRSSVLGSVPASDDGTTWCFLRSELQEMRDLNADGDTIDSILGIWLRP